MEKDAKYFVVGVFVSVCLVAMVGFLIWMAGAHDQHKYRDYTLYFTDSISGLKIGSAVQYKGVQVGKVSNIRLTPEREDLIKVDISVAEETPVRGKTRASLSMQGVTGMVFVQMTTDPADQSPPMIVENEPNPVIMANGTQLAKIFEDMPKISKQVLEMTEKMNKILSDETTQSLNQTLINLESMTRDFNGLLSEANVTNATMAMENISKSSASVNDLIMRFEKTADEIDKTVKTISDVVAANGDNVTKFTQEGLDQILSMSRETQRMTESIRRAADKLEHDPSQILYQPSYRGVEISQ